jgi:hypothetical protein
MTWFNWLVLFPLILLLVLGIVAIACARELFCWIVGDEK